MVDLTKTHELAAQHRAELEAETARDAERTQQLYETRRAQLKSLMEKWGIYAADDEIHMDGHGLPFVQVEQGITLHLASAQMLYNAWLVAKFPDGQCDYRGHLGTSVKLWMRGNPNQEAHAFLDELLTLRVAIHDAQTPERWGFDTFDEQRQQWFKIAPSKPELPQVRVVHTDNQDTLTALLNQASHNGYTITHFSATADKEDECVWFTAICELE